MMTKHFLPFAVSMVLAGLWAGCPSGDYDLGDIIGGRPGSGGGPAGGAGGTAPGGSSGTSTRVTFVDGRAQGAMTGEGWVSNGTGTTVTDPTCGADKHPITDPCAAINWSSASALCMSGSIQALPPAPTSDDYANNWGVELGINATQPAGGGLDQAFSTVTFTFTGAPTGGVRAQVHRKGDPDSTQYCAYVTSGTAVTLTSFSTECWVSGGTSLTAPDVANVDKIALQISSSFAPVSFQSFCLERIDFGK